MKTIIGLVGSSVDIAQPIHRLQDSGITDDRVSVISQEKAVRKLLGCEPSCVVMRYAAWGAAIGIAIYGIFAVFAALCQCGLMQYGRAYGIGTFLGGVLAGAFVGVVLGALVGMAEFEKDTHLYVQGVRMGDQVIVVQASETEIETVRAVLLQERASGVKAV
jgi:hypothetical protein